MRQLAVLAKVSRTTISLALRNHPSIPAATRDRIQQLAQQHGYRNDPLITTLMNQLRIPRKKRSIEKLAYLTSWNTANAWHKAPNDIHYHKGACQRAAALGYEIEHIWARQPGITKSSLSTILCTRGIRGVIIAPLLRPRGHFTLNWQHFAASTISYTISKPDLHRTSHSHFSGMTMTLRNLRHKGYRRIGLASLIEQDQRVDHAWQAAYLIHYHDRPPEEQISPLLVSEWNQRQFKAWLDKCSPDVVVSNNTDPFVFLEKLGYRVPDDIGYACLDLTSDSPYSGIDQLPEDVGRVAVDLVVGQLQNNEFGLPTHARTIQLDGLWKNGTTTINRHSPAFAAPGSH